MCSTRKKHRDIIFARKLRFRDFVFDQEIADIFDVMLDRSVPFYREIQWMVVEMACRFGYEGTSIYDVGCAAGTTVLKIAEQMKERNIKVVGVDNSMAMLEHAQEKLNKRGFSNRCELQCADLNRPLFLDNPNLTRYDATCSVGESALAILLSRDAAEKHPNCLNACGVCR